jgi:GNAT superfamily N-acetyltransferase
VRPGTPEDRAFAARHWVEGFTNSFPKTQRERLVGSKGSSYEERTTSTGPWNRFCYQHVEALLAEPGTQMRVACPPDDESVIYGVAVLRPPEIIHCVFVRPTWRRMGIAAALLDGIPLPNATVTTWCLDLSGHTTSWALEKYPTLKYTPFFVLAGDAERQQRQQLRRLGAWR